MKYILQCDFPYAGPWGEEMNTFMEGLAKSINDEPGVIWKFWTVNESKQEAGGIYLFDREKDAEAYLSMHEARLLKAGIPKVFGKIFAVNEYLSKINNAPL
ncbi:monooxygenase [Pseudomonas sp. NMI4491_12]|uniref:monooxygenase n=1 Tax=Pseudomonas sp. NMI4491_12 TaxID=2903146 RepID=UPI001E4F4141|nr:monooxygenase [Pseudomonas sp. NMI4491_12]MCE0968873.1 monooxygenase [Pseudomonas sp. NMI4491_12]